MYIYIYRTKCNFNLSFSISVNQSKKSVWERERERERFFERLKQMQSMHWKNIRSFTFLSSPFQIYSSLHHLFYPLIHSNTRMLCINCVLHIINWPIVGKENYESLSRSLRKICNHKSYFFRKHDRSKSENSTFLFFLRKKIISNVKILTFVSFE